MNKISETLRIRLKTYPKFYNKKCQKSLFSKTFVGLMSELAHNSTLSGSHDCELYLKSLAFDLRFKK